MCSLIIMSLIFYIIIIFQTSLKPSYEFHNVLNSAGSIPSSIKDCSAIESSNGLIALTNFKPLLNSSVSPSLFNFDKNVVNCLILSS